MLRRPSHLHASKHEGASQTLNLANIKEFLDLIFDVWLGDGVARQIETCRQGFAEVTSARASIPSRLLGSLAEQTAAYTYSRRPTATLVASLQIFTAVELQQLLCGKVEVEWSLQQLRRTVKPGYGTHISACANRAVALALFYRHCVPVLTAMCLVSLVLHCNAAYTDTDKAYVWLLEELDAMDQQERSAFLSFVTSSPRLPPGGLGQLPKGAIVVCHVLRVLLRPTRSRRVLHEINMSRLHTPWCNHR